MKFIQLNNISLSFQDKTLIKDLNLNIQEKCRIAFVGNNGCGKTSLLKIIAKELKPDYGSISKSRDTTIHYLPQNATISDDCTVYEEAEKAFSKYKAMQDKLEKLDKEISITQDEKTINSLLEKSHKIRETLELANYYNIEKQIYLVLNGLGFSNKDIKKDTSTFSGGWKMRVALAKALLSQPDFLLLDEPINYLDIEARIWLEEFIQRFAGGIILVAHDRDFLDKTTTETVEIFNGEVRRYPFSYSKYEEERKREIDELVKKHKEQEEYIKRTEAYIDRFRAKATKAASVQMKIKELEKLDIIEIPSSFKKIDIKFPQPAVSGKDVLAVENIGKSYGDKLVLKNVSFDVKRNQKIALTGINGAGKTTLLKILAGVIEKSEGDFKLGTNVSVGYFSQEHEKEIPKDISVLEYIENNSSTEAYPLLRSLLGAFLFSDDDVYKSTNVLSGGERNRLYLLKVLLQNSNFLILDEPTNHLDIHSKEVLLKALKEFEGTILFVSHDKYFLNNLAENVIEIDNKNAIIYHGNYDYYLWKKSNLGKEEEILAKPEYVDNKTSNKVTENKLRHEEYKKLRNRLRRLEKNEEEILEQIDGLESKLEDLNKQLQDPEVYSCIKQSTELSLAIEKYNEKIANLQNTWEANLLEIEEIKTSID